jgi:uncharacterized protein (DUF4415 family)
MEQESKVDLSEFDSLTDEEIRAAIAKDPDAAPELDDAALAAFLPAEEVLPQLVAAYRARRGPQRKPRKVPVSIRLSAEVVEYFRDSGLGWQSRIDDVLVEFVRTQADG